MKCALHCLSGSATSIVFVAFAVLLAGGCSTQFSGLGTGSGGRSDTGGSVTSSAVDMDSMCSAV